MTPIAQAIETIKAAAERVGISELAKAADVPYTTLKSFADRQWRNKNLDNVEALHAASLKILDPQEA